MSQLTNKTAFKKVDVEKQSGNLQQMRENGMNAELSK